MLILDEDGTVWEVDAEDVELEPDGSGFWLLAAEEEDEEDFYEFVDVEIELDAE